MNKEYIQKLERRIHNQRIALHQNWQIVEERANHRNTPLRSMWFDLVKKLMAENKELRKKLVCLSPKANKHGEDCISLNYVTTVFNYSLGEKNEPGGNMETPTIKCDTGSASDSYQFVALMRSNPKISWRANNRKDGTMCDGCFAAGMHLTTGNISYWLPVEMWEMLDGVGIATSLNAPA